VSRAGPDTRDRVLDAAEAVVVRQGIANLTLEAVAADAKMSKGGLLHYFPSKDRLIEGLVARCAEHWRAEALEAFEKTPPGPGRMARALLSHIANAREWTEQCQQSSCAAFASLAQNPRLMQPMRDVYSELRRRMTEDGLSPGAGDAILLAMDGLWLNRVLGLSSVDQARMNRLRAALESLVIVPARTSKTLAARVSRTRARPARAKNTVRKPR
jgi:AcrR family transcriptional regulator